MVLGEGQAGGIELTRPQPLIDVTREGKGRLHAVGRIRIEGLEPLAVQPCQIVGDAHQLAQLGDGAGARGPGQRRRILKETPLARGQAAIGFGEIQPLGR